MKKIILFFLSGLSIFNNAFGQAGKLDQTFSGGVVRTDLSDHTDRVSGIRTVQLKNGKLMALFTERGGFAWLTRYYSNGSPDLTFPLYPQSQGSRRFYILDGNLTSPPTDMITQSDGKLLISGNVYGDKLDFEFYRFDPNGNGYDLENFSTTVTPGQTDSATTLAVQPDGKILEVGTTYTGTNWNFAVVRFNIDGTLDTTFSGDGKLTTDFSSGNDVALSVVIQKDGKILVGGYTTPPSSTKKDFAIARYNSNGTLDLTFSGDGKLTTDFSLGSDVLKDLAVQSDGKIVAGGYSTLSNTDFAFARYSSTGVLDNSFSGDGKLTLDLTGNSGDTLQNMALQTDGKILAGGFTRSTSGNYDFALVRLNTSGSLDSTFQGGGIDIADMGTSRDIASKMNLLSDGRILMTGQSGIIQNDLVVARFTSSGAPDKTLQGNGRFTDYLRSYSKYNAVAIQNDGKVIAGGYTTDVLWYFTDNDIALTRYQISGQLDTTFSKDGIQKKQLFNAFSGNVTSLAIQKDGKVVAAGTGTTNGDGSPADFIVLRYNKDGSPDTSFGSGMATFDNAGNPIIEKGWLYIDFKGQNGDQANSLLLQPDGKILVAGISDNFDYASTLSLARLLPDGSYDQSFGSGGKETIQIPSSIDNGYPNLDGGGGLALQADGKILVTEWSLLRNFVDSTNTTEEHNYTALLRLLPNGTPDPSFGNNGVQSLDFATSISGLTLQPDGKILMAAAPGYTLARLKTNGALDTSFAHKGWVTTTFIPAVSGGFNSLALQTDGKIVAGGIANGSFALARYKSNGSLDSAFASNGLQYTSSITQQGLDPTGINDLGGVANAIQIQGNRVYEVGWSFSKGDGIATIAAYDLALGMFTYYRDVDQDGYGNSAKSMTAEKQPWGYVLQGGDCNDNNASVYPGAPELCDGLDNNCNGVVDEGLAQKTFYRDYDGDGFGDIKLTTKACAAPPGYASKAGDCQNADKTIYPGAPELCDGKDNNCNGIIDEGCPMVMDVNAQHKSTETEGLYATVYPNPSTSTFQLLIQSNMANAVDIHIYDVLGKTMERINQVAPNYNYVFGSKYRPGVYEVIITQSGKQLTLQLVKQSP